ncbi:MAG: PhoH family protein [Thermodesulfobacteriota bacterium]|nr:PhoH family protein [Thermodesulfobacteriota bacterium]
MKSITFENIDMARELFGRHNSNLARISEACDVKIDARGNGLNLTGDDEKIILAEKILLQLYDLLREKFSIQPADIDSAIKALQRDSSCKLRTIFLDTVFTTAKNRPITPRTPNQKKYVDAVRKHDIVFSIGPAGTGKTYLAMAMALSALSKGTVNRIVLTRPAVEAGETLGFLPGDLADKVNPYLRPLYDALYEMLSFEKARELIEQNVIEIAPLAFMRGRTLNNSFIILDEAQNTTKEQMKMFLTRIGYSARAIITGDITQTDLPSGKNSGLIDARNILQNIKGLEFIYFTREDVVRHRLVGKIIEAYEISTRKKLRKNET